MCPDAFLQRRASIFRRGAERKPARTGACVSGRTNAPRERGRVTAAPAKCPPASSECRFRLALLRRAASEISRSPFLRGQRLNCQLSEMRGRSLGFSAWKRKGDEAQSREAEPERSLQHRIDRRNQRLPRVVQQMRKRIAGSTATTVDSAGRRRDDSAVTGSFGPAIPPEGGDLNPRPRRPAPLRPRGSQSLPPRLRPPSRSSRGCIRSRGAPPRPNRSRNDGLAPRARRAP